MVRLSLSFYGEVRYGVLNIKKNNGKVYTGYKHG